MTGKGAANDSTASKRGSVMVSRSSATFARILGRNSSTALALKGLLTKERNRRWSGVIHKEDGVDRDRHAGLLGVGCDPSGIGLRKSPVDIVGQVFVPQALRARCQTPSRTSAESALSRWIGSASRKSLQDRVGVVQKMPRRRASVELRSGSDLRRHLRKSMAVSSVVADMYGSFRCRVSVHRKFMRL